jgi:hypothetical protein
MPEPNIGAAIRAACIAGDTETILRGDESRKRMVERRKAKGREIPKWLTEPPTPIELRCRYPNCTCKIVPAQVAAALKAAFPQDDPSPESRDATTLGG